MVIATDTTKPNGKMIGIHQQVGVIEAYLTIPQKMPIFKGAVIIVHELWGLTDHIKRVADKVAAQGYFVLAPNLYSNRKTEQKLSEELQVVLFEDSEQARYAAQPKLRALIAPTRTPQFVSVALNQLASCFEYMYNQPLVHQKVAVIGYGLGGTFAYSMAIREPRLKGAMPFYGHATSISPELRHIACPILAVYGGKDANLLSELDRLAPRMRQAGVDFEPIIYEQAGHGFFNDDNAYSYDKNASEDAWRRMANFLHDNLT